MWLLSSRLKEYLHSQIGLLMNDVNITIWTWKCGVCSLSSVTTSLENDYKMKWKTSRLRLIVGCYSKSPLTFSKIFHFLHMLFMYNQVLDGTWCSNYKIEANSSVVLGLYVLTRPFSPRNVLSTFQSSYLTIGGIPSSCLSFFPSTFSNNENTQ